MFFQLFAPFYDRFIKFVKVDHSGKIPEWLAPVDGMDVLDLGGGTGINAAALAGAGARVTLVDSSQAMLKRVAAKKLTVRLILADAATLPLDDSTFDIVLVSDAWHHFRDQAGVVREVMRVLRPGGRLCIIDFDPYSKVTKTIALLERIVAEPSTFTLPDDLVEMLRRVGIEGTYRRLQSFQYIYIGVKKVFRSDCC